MGNTEQKTNEIVVFKPQNGNIEFQVILDNQHDTVWATEQQMMDLFGKARRTIGEHIKNIYSEGELEKDSTWRESRQVQKEGGRNIERKVSFYNLDVVISVGYRVKSQVGVEFRKWATSKLKEYLIKGYTINQEKLKGQQEQIKELENALVQQQDRALQEQSKLTTGFISIIEHYSKTFELLKSYDTEEFSSEGLNEDVIYIIDYHEVKAVIEKLKQELIKKGEADELFGNEKDKSFSGFLGSISQTVFGELAYPTIEEQAAQLLYSIVKGHAFSDGNKRIGSLIFVWFLEKNNFHLNEFGERKINNITLTSLVLAIAQSKVEQREIIIQLIINLIKN